MESKCGLTSVTEAQGKSQKRKHLALDATACRGLILPLHCGPSLPSCGGRAAVPSCASFISWPGGFAVPWNPICELSPPPTSHLQSPLLPRTRDTTGQIGVSTCLASHLSRQESRESSSQQPVTFLRASLPRGQPGGHLCPADGQKILLAWSCRATPSVTISHMAVTAPHQSWSFPLCPAPESNLFIT